MNYINGSELTGKKFVRLENGDLWEVKRGKFVPEVGEDAVECFMFDVWE